MSAASRRSETPPLDPDVTVGAGLQKVLASALRTLRSVGMRGDPVSPEAIHRFRVGVRRLRSILSAFRDALPAQEHHDLGAQLAATAQRYGRAREWDVFLTDTLAPLRAALPRDQPLSEVEAVAAEARRHSLPPETNIFADIVVIEAAFEEAEPWLRPPGAEWSALWQSPLRDFAADLLERRHRRLRRSLKGVDLAEHAAFHQLRIRVKKLRYPSEMLRSLFDEGPATAYVERLVALQNVLGHLNDALVADGLLTELPLPSRPDGLIAGWLAREMQVCRERFPAAMGAFRRADPFWDT